MFRSKDDLDILGKKSINCLLTDGGVGDMIASMVVVDYIHKTYPHVNLLVWVPDYILQFAQNLLPNLSVRDFTSAIKKYNSSLPGISTRWNGRHSGMKVHLVDYSFHMLCDEHVDNTKKNYLKANLDKVNFAPVSLARRDKYVVMTTGFTAPNREFKSDYVNEVVDYIRSLDYQVVFLGKKQAETGTKHIIKGQFSDKIDFTKGFNLIDKTTLLQAAKIMSQAKAVVGLDNGLLHVAACTDVPIVGGFTNVDPLYRMPVRNDILGHNYYPVVPPESLGCRFCQTRMNFMYGYDFKECFYKDYECLKQLEAKLYIEQLEKIL